MKSSSIPETERRNPKSAEIDTLSVPEALEVVIEDVLEGASKVREAIPLLTPVVDACVASLRSGGRLFYVGAGTSGRLGVLDASECPPTFGTDPSVVQGVIAGGDEALRSSKEGVEDDGEAAEAAMRGHEIDSRDVVVGIAASGRTPFVLSALSWARKKGAVTVGVAFVADPELAMCSDYVIAIPLGPEVIAGSTRLKAGTATKVILNALSTTVMIRLGKVYSNLMVDLMPRCEKLRRRALHIIELVTGFEEEAARDLLERSSGSVKLALVMGVCTVDRDEAAALLERENGFLRPLLDERGSSRCDGGAGG